MRPIFLSTILLVVLLTSCRKNDAGSGGGSEADKIKDTSISYARDIYLWYDQIPSSFKARSYSDPNKIMEAIRAYSKEPGFANPVDRWSFATKKVDWDNTSSGIAKDFGLNIFFRTDNDLRVRLVEPLSPAGLAGVKRGWRITKINGNTNITAGNADFIVDAVYLSSTVSLTFQKPDGNSVDLNFTEASYQSKSIYGDYVFDLGASKVGYLVYNSFLGDSATTIDGFAATFNRFSSESVNDVIVDLRYNGGGYVSYQQALANYLVPASGNGGLMMKQEFNDKYNQYNSSVNFSKKGNLNLSRLFVIVSNNTASASELLINNLKPYMNVIVVGPQRTYGKPVGYFDIPVGDWYIFPVSTRTTNKNGEGNYFDGFALNHTVADGIDKDFGDPAESALASVLKYIGTGSFRIPVVDEAPPLSEEAKSANKKMSEHDFKGMLMNRVPGMQLQ
ncbi:MAG: S41 family peptidase [Chitinophagaceae bacterium]|nr:S41 family peptidase [Chitinophagaceae bacterium]